MLCDAKPPKCRARVDPDGRRHPGRRRSEQFELQSTARIGAEADIPSYLISDSSELDAEWLRNVETVGITAGASAPEELVEEVVEALRRIAPVEVSKLSGVEENYSFRLPAEILTETLAGIVPASRTRARQINDEVLWWEFHSSQMAKIGAYVLRQQLAGRKRFPLVLMLEPLFRLQSRLRRLRQDRLSRQDPEPTPARSPIVWRRSTNAARRWSSSPAASRCCTRKSPQIVKGAIAREQIRHRLHQCAAARKEDRSVQAQPLFQLVDPSRRRRGDARSFGLPERASTSARSRRSSSPRQRGFRVNINCTLFNDAEPARVAAFFDDVMTLGHRRHHGVARLCLRTGAGPAALPQPRQDQAIVPRHFPRGRGGKAWPFFQSPLFLDFLAGNRTYHCTPWGNPTRTVFGWQRPCYLLGEGYAKTFKELMEDDRLGQLRHRQL